MKTPLKIAVYSGDIPSTTFIERLIVGLSQQNCQLLLFGRIKRKPRYSNNVKVLGYYSNNIYKGFYLLYYSIILFLFKKRDKQKLDQVLKENGKHSWYDKVKCYPVLWHQPDVFHVQWAKGIADWVWIQAFGMKLVLSLRGAHINYSPIADINLANTYRATFPKVDAFHAVSKAIAKETQKYFAAVEKIRVVYSGLDNSLIKQPLNSKSNSVLQLISVGRPHWKKGYSYALDACKQLKDSGVAFRYTIIGGANALECQYQILDLGLQAEVKLLGQLPYETVQNYIKNSDVLVLPSVEEGIANVVLEAMSIGTLVLSTRCGGMEEVLIDGVNGFLVPVRDSKAMAERLLVIKSLDEEKRQQIEKAALETINTQHCGDLMIRNMIELYQDVLNKNAL